MTPAMRSEWARWLWACGVSAQTDRRTNGVHRRGSVQVTKREMSSELVSWTNDEEKRRAWCRLSANHRYVQVSSPTYSTSHYMFRTWFSSSASYWRRKWSFDWTDIVLSFIPREREDPTTGFCGKLEDIVTLTLALKGLLLFYLHHIRGEQSLHFNKKQFELCHISQIHVNTQVAVVWPVLSWRLQRERNAKQFSDTQTAAWSLEKTEWKIS